GLVVSAASGSATTTPDPAATPAPSAPTEFGLIKEAWDTLHQQYVARGELDDRALIYGAIDGMTQAVGDTGHTDFMTPEEREDRNDALSGSYVGIGVRIEPTEAGLPQVIGVFDGSPAESAGLQSGDVIVAVDGRSTTDQTIDEVATWVRGEAGTTVKITVRADGTGPERTYDVVRADVPIQPVSWTLVPGSTTALIRLDQFSNGAADDMVKALDGARAAGADRVVLDLRGNPGGYVNEAVGIASQFLQSGVVYIERDADGKETTHEVSPDGVATDLPLVVIVDKNTASSSEIVSGALQDAGRAEIVGETTFGTGTVLGEFVLTDGSALRVGTVEWLTPDGRRIWHEGIAPDVPVSADEGATPATPDDVRAMSPAQVAAMDDAPLARALELVADASVATTD
ncbi:MAG: S41 family peptidase, partial [Candidatus Limnocylindrales bacterium]